MCKFLLAAGMALACVGAAHAQTTTRTLLPSSLRELEGLTMNWTGPHSFEGNIMVGQPGGIFVGGTHTWVSGWNALNGAGHAEFSSFTNQTGALTSGPGAYHIIRVATDDVVAPGVGATALEVDHYTSAGIRGGREAIYADLDINGTPGDNGQYVGVGESFQAKAPANSDGNQGFGSNPGCGITSVATGNWACIGEEIDVQAESGSTPTGITGLTIVTTAGHRVAGSSGLDSAIAIGNQPGATAGWTYAFRIGGPSNLLPLASNATLFFTYPGTGNTSIANGVDIHNNMFSGNSWNDGHIQITGSGHIAATNSMPRLSFCGASPTLDATASDLAGTVTPGNGARSCTITFHSAFATPPHCALTGWTSTPPHIVSETTAALTVSIAGGAKFTYSGCTQ